MAKLGGKAGVLSLRGPCRAVDLHRRVERRFFAGVKIPLNSVTHLSVCEHLCERMFLRCALYRCRFGLNLYAGPLSYPALTAKQWPALACDLVCACMGIGAYRSDGHEHLRQLHIGSGAGGSLRRRVWASTTAFAPRVESTCLREAQPCTTTFS